MQTEPHRIEHHKKKGSLSHLRGKKQESTRLFKNNHTNNFQTHKHHKKIV